MTHALARPAEPQVSVPACPPSPLWVVPGVPAPKAKYHHDALRLLEATLLAWAVRGSLDASVVYNMAMHWAKVDERICMNPDLALLSPAPPEGKSLMSVQTWLPGHHPPRVVVAVVSRNHPYKDYAEVPRKCASLGVQELWVFDPLLVGPGDRGGPYLLQVWKRSAEDGTLTRVHAGSGPAYSDEVGGWLVVIDDGETLRIAEDPGGQRLWPTPEETERQAKEAARQAKQEALRADEAERQSKEAALARVAELEAELARTRKK